MNPTAAERQELAKAYDPAAIERGLYDWWDESGYFQPSESDRPPFVIVMPPPNVTGELHIGHALFVSLEDLMIRWHRMRGDPSLWIPGADHAGIAGQWVVEKELAAEGLTRHDLGREAFLDRVWDWMNRYRGRIREQLKLLGASCDWSRFAFTMDPGPSRAVRHVFKHLYDKGLIYRGERLISWCPRCRTALSDLEVVYRDEASSLWYLAYPVEDAGGEKIVVATTRPETMLGDTGVAVHPDDERYRHLIGKHVILPILGRRIPVVTDEAVDPAFGTGAVKVTPAHDPNDFEIGRRHGLPFITVMDLDGTMNAAAGPFAGQATAAARAAVVAELERLGALVETKPHQHAIGHCQRCDTVVEPLISKQWFVEMAPLAKPAVEVAKDGRIEFVPDRFRGVYLNWLENIHDWCISRQLWWGHRIPVWYCQDSACGEITVSVEETVDQCPACGGAVEQDPDVLDTWFSSGLWPFSTLGWPDDTPDLRRFYPSSVMETGYDILFFWVARMVFFGIEIMNEVPFHTVYLHGTVRDAEGARMSKTKGNVQDPTEIAATYGADALRFTLLTQAAPGNDMRLSLQRVESARNFANKLWNATRFALRWFERSPIALDEEGPVRPEPTALADRWILSRLDTVNAEATRLLESHLYGEAGRQIQDFVWSELCDWYIEAAKVRQGGSPDDEGIVAATLAYVLERAVRLLHPFMPFLTEAIWRALPHQGQSIMVAPWLEPSPRDEEAEEAFGALIDLVRSIRNARAEAGVEPGRWIAADVYGGRFATAFRESAGELAFLARVGKDQLRFVEVRPEAGGDELLVVAGEAVAALPLTGIVDLVAERERLTKEIAEAQAEQDRALAQLDNKAFVSRAPQAVVEVQRRRLATSREQVVILQERLQALGS
ncbi:MAG TPA: valine--tRNA ligase [Thermomicrobiales bacterium]|nr:valine--tRNA ligase [Thermomicrobiales bacterium]